MSELPARTCRQSIGGCVLSRRLLALLVTGFTLLGSLNAGAATHRGWRTDIRQALEEAEGKPTVLLFSAPWCSWCHLMLEEADTSEEVQVELEEVMAILVDTDRNIELAAHFEVRGVPAVAVTNAAGELVAFKTGYQPPKELAATIRRAHEGRGERSAALWPDLGSDDPEDAESLVAVLGRGTIRQRQLARERLTELSEAEPLLWDALSDPKLGVRLDAAAILAAKYDAPVHYDPFAPSSEWATDAKRWRSVVIR